MRTILTTGLLLAGLKFSSLAEDETDFQAWKAGGDAAAAAPDGSWRIK